MILDWMALFFPGTFPVQGASCALTQFGRPGAFSAMVLISTLLAFWRGGVWKKKQGFEIPAGINGQSLK